MNKLHIQDTKVRLAVNGDEQRVIAFDPASVDFVEKFYSLIGSFEKKEQAYRERAAELDEDKAVDAYGIPTNMPARIALLRETCEFARAQIDYVFGEGTSKAAFGDTLSLDVYPQFFDGITPYIQKERQGKIDKYLDKTERDLT